MTIFNPTLWLIQESKLKQGAVDIAGIDFEYLTLTDDLIETAELSKDLDELYEFCSINGLAAEGERAVNKGTLTDERVKSMWELPQLKDLDINPSAQVQFAQFIIKESGLQGFADSLIPEEESHLDGDELSEEQLSQHLGDFQSQQS